MSTQLMNVKPTTLCLAIFSTFSTGSIMAANFEGPDSVENTIAQQTEQKKDWRNQLADKGFTFGADYFALGLKSPNGVDGSSVNAASGVARLYGSWNLLGMVQTMWVA